MNEIPPFTHFANSNLVFGAGNRKMLPTICKDFGAEKVALVASVRFFGSEEGRELLDRMSASSDIDTFSHAGEPTPASVDSLTERIRAVIDGNNRAVVVAVGGGSIIDAAKASAAMLCEEAVSVRELLEGVGSGSPSGRTLPLIAVPTTAGTGSEATKNSVIAEPGLHGFKKSFRHNNFIPRVALLDPELHLSCPAEQSFASGLDSLSQLLEGYTSSRSSPIIEPIALSGTGHFLHGFPRVIDNPNDLEARGFLAFAAYCSGLAIANAGLGAIHGIAGPLCGRIAIPHGVACARLLMTGFEILEKADTDQRTRSKITRLNSLAKAAVPGAGSLSELLREWSGLLPGLGHYGLTSEHFDTILKQSSGRDSPHPYTPAELRRMLERAL